MTIAFRGAIWYWRGPAPWFFVSVPEAQADQLRMVAGAVSYGWGMIPVRARVGGSVWSTSLFPKDGSYVLPVRASVRGAERLAEGDTVAIRLEIG